MPTQIPFRVVVDTNVVFEGVTKQGGACGLIVEAWSAGLFRPFISNALAYEYADVLSRLLSAERWQKIQPVKEFIMSQLTLELPQTLHHQLEKLAQGEGVSLSQYILFALTRQTALSYFVQSVPEKDVAQQRSNFANLLNSLGQASFAEIEKIMQEREVVEPELGLTPEVVKRLQERIANQKMQSNRT